MCLRIGFQTTVITTTTKITVSMDGPTTIPIGHYSISLNAIGKNTVSSKMLCAHLITQCMELYVEHQQC